ncbi:MAG: DUF2887 domain-containing protein [Synechococcales cyanobacterium RU_4_20]|nr:DUF2887 domain-containing protein [Synechococcales cyanobacterium RU_4_20]
MRRDSIFYQLFQQSPVLLFDLLEEPPANADQYRFDSVAIKEPKFEIDGVFLPPEADPPGIVFYCEVQFQRMSVSTSACLESHFYIFIETAIAFQIGGP